jgi:hypothetical protein
VLHPEIMKLLADDRIESLRAQAAGYMRGRSVPLRDTADTRDVELRLCRVSDEDQLGQLAELEGRPLPFGRLVVAAVHGRIVAALPLGGGRTLADPFVRTDHIVPLLELRAAQLREPARRRVGLLRYASLIRGSSHA